MAFISVRNETKRYEMGTNTIVANHDISFDID